MLFLFYTDAVIFYRKYYPVIVIFCADDYIAVLLNI